VPTSEVTILVRFPCQRRPAALAVRGGDQDKHGLLESEFGDQYRSISNIEMMAYFHGLDRNHYRRDNLSMHCPDTVAHGVR
jgi:hypothetical protein